MKAIEFMCLIKRNFIQGAILLVIVFSFIWLISMVFVLGARSTQVDLEYRIYLENADNTPIRNPQVYISDDMKHDDALFKVFKEAEEHLRNQLTSWLTILGFFAIVFGLLMPLINYMLQRQTLSDERDRISKDFDDRVKRAIAQVDDRINQSLKKVDEHIEDANKKAESAMNVASQTREAFNKVSSYKQPSELMPNTSMEAMLDIAKESK